MFNLGSAELILILLVAFIIVGPKDLPRVGRAIGRWVRQLREMFDEFKEETGLSDTLEDLKDTERELNTVLRESDPRTELKDAVNEASKSMSEAKQSIRDGMPGNKKKL